MTMRRYEVVYVLAPTLTPEEVDQYAENFSEAAREQGAEVIEVEKWEKRKLAFRVKKFWEGYYTILTIEEEAADAVTELERRFKVNDIVIRFLTVRIDEEVKRAAKFKKDEEPVADKPVGSRESTEEEKPSSAPKVEKPDAEDSKESKPEESKPEEEAKEPAKPAKKAAARKTAKAESEDKESGEKEETGKADQEKSEKDDSTEEEKKPVAKKKDPAEADVKKSADEKPEDPEEEKSNG